MNKHKISSIFDFLHISYAFDRMLGARSLKMLDAFWRRVTKFPRGHIKALSSVQKTLVTQFSPESFISLSQNMYIYPDRLIN